MLNYQRVMMEANFVKHWMWYGHGIAGTAPTLLKALRQSHEIAVNVAQMVQLMLPSG